MLSEKKDLINTIFNLYSNINPVYKHSFWILFIITNIVFGFYTINFFWGNHDWEYMVNGIPISRSFFEGRYGAYLISKILTGGLYLPIISALWAFAALSLSSILLAIYWKIPQRIAYFVILGLILNITPYTCVWFFFGHWIVDVYFARLFILISFLLTVRYAFRGTKTQKIFANLLAILLLNFSISVYQSLIGTIVMVFAGRILVEMLEWTSFKTGFITSFKQNKWTMFDIISAVILYKIIFQLMRYKNLIRENFYNMRTISLPDMPSKIFTCIKAAWQQFTDFSMVFYPDILTKLFLVLALIWLIQILLSKKRSWILKISIIMTFFAILFLTKTVACVSGINILHDARIDLCGYVLFNVLIICLCFKTGNFLQDIKIIMMGVIIYLFAVNCLYYQRTYYLGFDTEKMIWNRMLGRLESHPDFNPKQKYLTLQLGKHISAREKFYPKNIKTIRDREMITYSFDCTWRTLTAINFYNFGFIKRTWSPDSFNDSDFMKALKRLYDAGLLENAKAWPDKNSIIVYDDIILIVMDDKKLEEAKLKLAQKNEQ